MKRKIWFSGIGLVLILLVILIGFAKSEDIPFRLTDVKQVDHQIKQTLNDEDWKRYANQDVYQFVENEQDLESLKIVENTTIDFDKASIVFLTRGTRGNQEYDIELTKIEKKKNKLFIYVKKSDPDNILMAMTQFNYMLYSIDNSKLEGVDKVKFVESN